METILSTTTIGQGHKMKLESCTLQLADGSSTDFERAGFHDNGQGIMIIPITDDNHIILIEHFCIGSEQPEIMLPGGYRDHGYEMEEISNKELQEEIGYKASKIDYLTNLHILPGYIKAKTTICVASGLIPSSLPGDEFETITVHIMTREQITEAIDDERINDCRTIAALMYYKNRIETRFK